MKQASAKDTFATIYVCNRTTEMLFNPFFAFMSHFNTEIYMMKDGRATQTKKDATHTNKKHYVISNIKNKIM